MSPEGQAPFPLSPSPAGWVSDWSLGRAGWGTGPTLLPGGHCLWASSAAHTGDHREDDAALASWPPCHSASSAFFKADTMAPVNIQAGCYYRVSGDDRAWGRGQWIWPQPCYTASPATEGKGPGSLGDSRVRMRVCSHGGCPGWNLPRSLPPFAASSSFPLTQLLDAMFSSFASSHHCFLKK